MGKITQREIRPGSLKDWSGEDVVQLRQDYSLTQIGLGELLGVAKETISRWENGANDISRLASRALSGVEASLKRRRPRTATR